jgi:hypothetical protein
LGSSFTRQKNSGIKTPRRLIVGSFRHVVEAAVSSAGKFLARGSTGLGALGAGPWTGCTAVRC